MNKNKQTVEPKLTFAVAIVVLIPVQNDKNYTKCWTQIDIRPSNINVN